MTLTFDDLEAMPAGVTFGRVTGNVSMFVGDVPFDSDSLPDRMPLAARITFTPNVAYVIVEGDGEDEGDIIFQTTITADVQRDGSFAVDLVATDCPRLNPTRWAYDVTISPQGAPALKARVAVPGGTTQKLGKLIGAAQPGVAVAKVGPTITWDGTTMIVDGKRGPDLGGVTSAEMAQLVTGYDDSMSTSPIAGARTVAVPESGTTYAIDLAGDATLTMVAPHQGVTVALDVVTHGHALTVTDGPTITSDGLSGVLRSRGVWSAGVGGGGAVQLVAVTPAAPTWTDSPDGGGMYTIPAKSGIKYMVAVGAGTAVATAAGDYPVDPKTKITVTAVITDENRFYLADGAAAGWAHTFPSSKYTLVTQVDFSKVPDTQDVTTVATSNGTKVLQIWGKTQVIGGKAQNLYGVSGSKTDCGIGLNPRTNKTRATASYVLGDPGIGGGSAVSIYIGFGGTGGSVGVVINPDGTFINTAVSVSDVTKTSYDATVFPAQGTVVIELDNTTQLGTVWVNGVKKFTNYSPNMNTGPVGGFTCQVAGNDGHAPSSITAMKVETF